MAFYMHGPLFDYEFSIYNVNPYSLFMWNVRFNMYDFVCPIGFNFCIVEFCVSYTTLMTRTIINIWYTSTTILILLFNI